VSRLYMKTADMITMPMPPRYLTISEVEYQLDASLIQAPITENIKAAKSIQRDCICANSYPVANPAPRFPQGTSLFHGKSGTIY
jgi:hypothetical protein